MAQTKDSAGAGDRSPSAGAMRIDPSLVRELAELLSANELTEIEVEDGDRRIKVKREAPAMIATAAAPAFAPAAAAAAPALSAPPMAAKEDVGSQGAEEIGGTTVKSPMVGTAFLSPEPGAAPFIEVGKAVKAGDTLLIVEAMKVMNPITAPEGGVIKKIIVADAQPVEFDQPLVIIG
jgi:acetyl-CoA carboxylase biotin carboxyl carrier protein